MCAVPTGHVEEALAALGRRRPDQGGLAGSAHARGRHRPVETVGSGSSAPKTRGKELAEALRERVAAVKQTGPNACRR